MVNTDPGRPDVVAGDGAHLHIANALYLWEGGEFSEWVDMHGFPLEIDGETFAEPESSSESETVWEKIEDALANFSEGPYDPNELEEVD